MSNFAALLDRRYLVTSAPWRALLYLASTVPVAAPLACVCAVLVLPYAVTLSWGLEGTPPSPAWLVAMVLTLLTFLLLGPVTAVPLGAIERARLGLIDQRPLPSPHPPGPREPLAWLRARYSELATWRELFYGLFLGLLVPAAYGIFALLVVVDVAMVLSPLLVSEGVVDLSASQERGITFGSYLVETPAQAYPVALFGLLLAPALVYLAGLMAAGQAATARALLGDRTGLALREVTRSRARLADAFDLERRRIERDLHDGAQHRLTSLTLHLGMARLDVPADSPAAEPLGKAHDQAKDLMVVLRDLIYGIRPQELTDLGLPAALRELAGRSPLPVAVTVADGVSRPGEQTEGTAYFAASEALANVVKHADATRADVLLAQAGETLILEVRDDGRGGADPGTGTGLTGLADRVAAADGRLLLSSPEGGPTLVRVELPCSK